MNKKIGSERNRNRLYRNYSPLRYDPEAENVWKFSWQVNNITDALSEMLPIQSYNFITILVFYIAV